MSCCEDSLPSPAWVPLKSVGLMRLHPYKLDHQTITGSLPDVTRSRFRRSQWQNSCSWHSQQDGAPIGTFLLVFECSFLGPLGAAADVVGLANYEALRLAGCPLLSKLHVLCPQYY